MVRSERTADTSTTLWRLKAALCSIALSRISRNASITLSRVGSGNSECNSPEGHHAFGGQYVAVGTQRNPVRLRGENFDFGAPIGVGRGAAGEASNFVSIERGAETEKDA